MSATTSAKPDEGPSVRELLDALTVNAESQQTVTQVMMDGVDMLGDVIAEFLRRYRELV